MTFLDPPELLRQGRRALEFLQPVKILEDWDYEKKLKKWFLRISITLESSSMIIPTTSQWYVVVTADYPLGSIKVYPDVENSITVTFPHQGNNGQIHPNSKWRMGSLCLNENVLSCFSSEPTDSDSRLSYHVERAIIWLESAMNNALAAPSDLFELPDFTAFSDAKGTFAFVEDHVSFMQWEARDEMFGYLTLKPLKPKSSIFCAMSFCSINQEILHCSWGTHLSGTSKELQSLALWIRLKKAPVIHNWQAPVTLGELIDACSQQNTDLLQILKTLFHKIRDGRKHYLVFGFPIPKYEQGESELMFWQSLQLPVLSRGKKYPKGFRQNERGWWQHDKQTFLRPSEKISWVKSENWSKHEILQRGQLEQKVSNFHVLLIGAGSLASCVSEILIRTGITRVSIVDYDRLEIGNLSRHTLDLNKLGENKALSLATKLNMINPHARVQGFPQDWNEFRETYTNLESFDLILDCTGSDDVLQALNSIHFKKKILIISASMTLGADQLYLYIGNEKDHSFHGFSEIIRPHLEKVNEKYINYQFPRNGTGCWSPTFPARLDDIYLFASTVVKIIDKCDTIDLTTPVVSIYEKKFDLEGNFNGIEKIY